ncbi:BspA family leucine-rich repeat surface protein [Mycoplasma cottewii]|uniref:BspA family leucine-rich repeat surface protein n=1 Tax=Mycoplasma cottewii TaxID=51364 RepID=A0ABY5U0F8_9MOLU|nr:BspA family leucine-rich repeat surface protein [Mycoplasma cottewii]UWD34779.1 BspA family leucine-rich repeat surface protein [Mycoplasma cottewii]
MKMFKWLGLGLLTATSVISTSCVIANSISERNQYINSQDNNSAGTLAQNLNRKVDELKTKITEVDENIKSLETEKKDLTNLTTQLSRTLQEKETELGRVKTELETEKNNHETIKGKKEVLEREIGTLKSDISSRTNKLSEMNKELGDKNKEIKDLRSKLQSTQDEITKINTENDDYKQMITNIWNSKMKNTVYSGEKYQSLLNRFEKTTGVKVDLDKQDQANKEIGDGENKKLIVKKGSMKLELDTGDIYPKIRKQKTKPYNPRTGGFTESTEVTEVGYSVLDSGEVKIEPLSRISTKVSGKLPWFVTNLDEAFYNHRIEFPFYFGLENWDVSNVTSMNETFSLSLVNAYLGGWDTRNVESFQGTFSGANGFDGNISSWWVFQANTFKFVTAGCPLWAEPLWTTNLPHTIRARYTTNHPQEPEPFIRAFN